MSSIVDVLLISGIAHSTWNKRLCQTRFVSNFKQSNVASENGNVIPLITSIHLTSSNYSDTACILSFISKNLYNIYIHM